MPREIDATTAIDVDFDGVFNATGSIDAGATVAQEIEAAFNSNDTTEMENDGGSITASFGNLTNEFSADFGSTSSSGGGGTDNYELLINKPQINLVTLVGNKTSSQLGLQDAMQTITAQDIDEIMFGGNNG